MNITRFSLPILRSSWIKLSWHSCSMWTNLDDSIDSGNFSVILLLVYLVLQFSLSEGSTPVCLGCIPRKSWGFLFSTAFTSFSDLLIFPLSITFFVFVHNFWCYFIKRRWGFSRSTYLLINISLETSPSITKTT